MKKTIHSVGYFTKHFKDILEVIVEDEDTILVMNQRTEQVYEINIRKVIDTDPDLIQNIGR